MTTETGRANQRQRTRKDLLQAATRLLKQGKSPSLEDVAAEAMVSRATAYRYFPSIEALLIEAPLDVALPDADEILQDGPKDPIARLELVDEALNEMIGANEAPLRLMLANAIQRPLRESDDAELPRRQNRRTALIDAALDPARGEFDPGALIRLSRALSLIMGTESMIVFKDVLQVNDEDAAHVRRWAIRALVDAARKPST